MNASKNVGEEDGAATTPASTRKPRVSKPGTETFQLLDFPSVLLNQVNNTAGYLETPRLDFVVRILEAAMIEIEVPEMQQRLKDKWEKWCKQHPKKEE